MHFLINVKYVSQGSPCRRCRSCVLLIKTNLKWWKQIHALWLNNHMIITRKQERTQRTSGKTFFFMDLSKVSIQWQVFVKGWVKGRLKWLRLMKILMITHLHSSWAVLKSRPSKDLNILTKIWEKYLQNRMRE